MKKFWKYFLILILLLSGLFCVGLLYLFFVPNSSMFGITYVSYSNKYQSKMYDKSVVQNIELNSYNYDIILTTSNSDNVYAIVKAKSFGYTLKENSKLEIKSEVVAGTLKINITEPNGLVFSNGSSIELLIPKDFTPNLKITNNKATTDIESGAITLQDFTYETKAGNLNFNYGSVAGEMNLNLNKAKFNLSSKINTTETTANITLTSGQFNAPNHHFKTINVLSNTSGLVNVKSCTSFNSQSKSAGGKFNIIDTVESVAIESSDTNIEIGTLKGGSIKLTESGKIYIKKIQGMVILQTNSGSITVDEATSEFTTISENGDQLIKLATQQITSDSTYGNISITFATPQTEEEESTFNLSAIATTKNGKITLNGVDKLTVGIVENGTGRADIKMRKVTGQNIIDAQRGSVNVTIPQTEIYWLTTESTAGGSVHVNVGQFAVNGYNTQTKTTNLISYSTEPIATANSLIVTTTSGSITILDSLMA